MPETERQRLNALNAALAERLFGDEEWPVPDYVGSWEGLGRVVDAMRARGWTFWAVAERCHFFRMDDHAVGPEMQAPTLPEAVALAALRALGGEG